MHDHTQRVYHLEDEVQKLQQELIQRENNRQILDTTCNNNNKAGLSDIDLEVNQIEPAQPVEINTG